MMNQATIETEIPCLSKTLCLAEHAEIQSSNCLSETAPVVETCPVCNLTFNAWDQMEDHVKSSECWLKMKQCASFLDRFTNQTTFVKELALSLSIDGKVTPSTSNDNATVSHQCYFKYKCTVCGKLQNTSSPDEGLLETLITEEVKPKQEKKPVTPRSQRKATARKGPPDVDRVGTSDSGRSECKICGRSVTSRQMKAHMKKKHGETAISPEQTYATDLNFENLLDIFSKSDAKPSEVCCKCGASFPTLELLDSHVRKRECRKKLRTKHSQVEVLTGDSPYKYKCLICQRMYTRRENCNRHVRTHSAQKVACNICGKEYLEGRCIKDHMVTHSEEKPFQCHVCGARFKTNQAVKEHLSSHSEEKLFKCSYCDKSFAHRQTLYAHRRIHTGHNFLCAVCGKHFNCRPNFIRHRRTHSGERPYVCGVCNKAFSQSNALKAHARIHTGVKPYRCQYCEKTFTENGTLKSHLATHTKWLNPL